MKKTVRINASTLSPTLQMRFDTLLQVAGRRSIVAWQLAESADSADVVIQELRDGAVATNTWPVPIYITDTPIDGQDVEVLRLDTAFRVSTLMDALDLAAVRVMKRWDATVRTLPQSVAAAAPPTAAPVAPAPPAEDAPAPKYQLKHWVFLGNHRASMVYTRTLAAMTQRGVTRQWMRTQGGLNDAQIDTLLADLRQRDALRVIESAPATAAASPTPVAAPPAAPTGFVGRLKRWLTGGRAQSLTV